MALWRLENIRPEVQTGSIHLVEVSGREYRTVTPFEILWPLIDFVLLFIQMLVFPFQDNMPWCVLLN
jgi:hypothetical protein